MHVPTLCAACATTVPLLPAERYIFMHERYSAGHDLRDDLKQAAVLCAPSSIESMPQLLLTNMAASLAGRCSFKLSCLTHMM